MKDSSGRNGPLDAGIDRTARVLGLLGGTVLTGLMGLTVVDVTLRYVFNMPLIGGQDIAEVLLLSVVALSLAYCGRTGGHVSVDLLASAMSRRIAPLVDLLVSVVCTVMMSIIVWRCFDSGVSAMEFGEASNLLFLPYAPFYFLLSFGFAAYVGVLLADALAALRRLVAVWGGR